MRHKYDFSVRRGDSGAIVTDEENEALGVLSGDSARYYAGHFLLCETIDGEDADRVVLCWEFCRALTNDDLRARIGAGRLP